jgi:small subunit ribosomal protein S1
MALQQQEENALSPKKIVKTLSKGMKLTGKVTNVTEFGAFVDIGVGRDGLVHISELRRQGGDQGSDTISTGDEVTVWIKDLDRKRNRISLTMREPARRKFKDLRPGMVVEGKVTRLVPYGAFVDIGLRRDGMVHVTEMAQGYVRDPADMLTAGDVVQVKVLEIDRKKRRVALSMKDLPEEGGMEGEEEEEALPTTMELAFRQAMAQQEDQRESAEKRKETRRPVSAGEQDDIITRTLRMHREQTEQ